MKKIISSISGVAEKVFDKIQHLFTILKIYLHRRQLPLSDKGPQNSLYQNLLNVNGESFAFKLRKETKRPFTIGSLNHRAGGLGQAVGLGKEKRDTGLDEIR